MEERVERKIPSEGDKVVLKIGDFLYDAEAKPDVTSGDMCWQVLKTGARVDWRKAEIFKGEVRRADAPSSTRADAPESDVDLEDLESIDAPKKKRGRPKKSDSE